MKSGFFAKQLQYSLAAFALMNFYPDPLWRSRATRTCLPGNHRN